MLVNQAQQTWCRDRIVYSSVMCVCVRACVRSAGYYRQAWSSRASGATRKRTAGIKGMPHVFSLIGNNHLLPFVDTQDIYWVRVFQGEQGPQGVLGPRGLPGEGFPGPKVSQHRVSDTGFVFTFWYAHIFVWQGYRGLPGERGIKGFKGDMGDAGSPGQPVSPSVPPKLNSFHHFISGE